CWRTDKPILYYPLDAWFIKTTALKDRMVELNKTINWKPKSTGEGRFGNWLENMVDWNLSRSRYWGTPLPIWKTEDGKEEKCIGSIEELLAEAENARKILGETVNQNLSTVNLDLHKPFVDEIVLASETGKSMKRVPDLVDVWFDSGAMPYAQWHYPFENKELVDSHKAFPADFICEGVDQTRGWFYTLHALAALLFDSVAYKTVVSNGLVLDKNGNKMSKRLGNVVDPFQTIDKFGADATRWYLITNASPWDNLKFDISGIQEVQRKFFGTLYNTYQFFALYSNLDGFAFKEEYIPLEQRPEIDRWILSSLNSLIVRVTESMDDYEPTQAGRAIEEFVDEHLSNWYVRLCRRRFWKGEYEHDKISAYQTLYECLETVVRLIAPVSPFFSDAVFQNLNAVTCRFTAASVHHVDFPKENKAAIDTLLEERMQLAQDASSLILSIRKKVNIKVRQPLHKVLIPVLNAGMKEQFLRIEDLIKSEVNVKEIEYITETEGFINKKIKPNFTALGKKLGPKMKAVSAALANLTQHDISAFEKQGNFILQINGQPLTLDLTEVEIFAEDIPGWSVASKSSLTVALDITVSEELRKEGEAREFVNRIQNLRKDSGFEITDRININIVENERLVSSINDFKNYICAEILADSINFVPKILNGTEIEINDIPLQVSVMKRYE
ncbi:MAG TPA: class I tRNA ligase family protein, partial [Segetibacter sp.]